MLVYLSHNFGNDPENVKHLEEVVKDFVKKYGDVIKQYRLTFISPLHGLGFLYDQVDYEEGMRMCLAQLKLCTMMVLFNGYDNSRGVNIEKQFCLDNHIPILTEDEFRYMLEEAQQVEKSNV